MVVDVHTHTPTHRDAVPADELLMFEAFRPDRPVQTTNSWADYDTATSAADVSIVFNIAVDDPLSDTGIPTNPERINEATAEFAAEAPTRRIGFMSLRPDRPDALSELTRCRSELGLRGIKLGPNYQRFEPLGLGAYAVYTEAERCGLPILFHQGASPIAGAPLQHAHPLAMDTIAMAYPRLRIVMAHMGHPWQADTIVVLRKHPHVYADVSALFYRPWSLYTCLRLATEWNVLDKLLLGSDFPIATTEETMTGLRAVNAIVEGTKLPEVPLDAIEAIFERDALGLLGLEDPA